MSTAIAVIILFCVVIAIHEFGHLIAAKKCNVKVNEFAIGMGPKIYSRQKGETKYSLRLLPIGGYCAMEGEDKECEDERGFSNASYIRRAIILFAGSLFNFLLAIVIMIGIVFYIGSPTNIIGEVTENSPASEAGIMSDDEIISINGTDIETWDDLSNAISYTEEETLEIIVNRDGENITVTSGVEESDGRYIIGVTPAYERNFFASIPDGIEITWNAATSMISALKDIITGEVGLDQLTGPIGITYAVNQSLNYGIINFMFLMALISVNLGIVNLLPLPALDGGRLLFLLINKITGKAVSEKVEGTIHLVGMALILLLGLYIAGFDIERFILPFFQ